MPFLFMRLNNADDILIRYALTCQIHGKPSQRLIWYYRPRHRIFLSDSFYGTVASGYVSSLVDHI